MSQPLAEEAPPSPQETPEALQSPIKEFGSPPNTSIPLISIEATEKTSPPIHLTNLSRAEAGGPGIIPRCTLSNVAPLCKPARGWEEAQSVPPKIKVSV